MLFSSLRCTLSVFHTHGAALPPAATLAETLTSGDVSPPAPAKATNVLYTPLPSIIVLRQSGVAGTVEREREHIICQALESVVLSALNPRMNVSVIVQARLFRPDGRRRPNRIIASPPCPHPAPHPQRPCNSEVTERRPQTRGKTGDSDAALLGPDVLIGTAGYRG